MEHILKCETYFWNRVRLGLKTFEVRKNDRYYQNEDTLILLPWSVETKQYETPGASVQGRVSFILYGGQFGIEAGYVVMALKDVEYRWAESDNYRPIEDR